jgi:nuclear RNA export factor
MASALCNFISVASPQALDEKTQLAMVEELAHKTGMTDEYAYLCLNGAANWDFELALQSFEESRGQLPAEVFTTTTAPGAAPPAAV